MTDELEFIDRFTCLLKEHAKAKLYDGIRGVHNLNEMLRLAVEELGDVASAITQQIDYSRERPILAFRECVDLAYCALLVALALDREHNISDD